MKTALIILATYVALDVLVGLGLYIYLRCRFSRTELACRVINFFAR